MSAVSSSLAPTVLFLVIIILIYVRRIARLTRGAPLTVGRLAAYAAFVVVLFALTVFLAVSVTPWYTYPIDAAIVIGAAFLSAGHVEERVVIQQVSPGQWTYRLGVVIPVTYLCLLIVRVVIDFVALNVSPLTISTAPVTLSPTALVVSVVVDFLFAASTGLAVGRSLGVYRRFQREKRSTPPPLPSAPLA